MIDLYEKTIEASEYIKKNIDYVPEAAVVLGTGLSKLSKDIELDIEIDYNEIPGFVQSTVESHDGKLVFGTLNGKKVVFMQGRFHYYEGYSMQEITIPIRVLSRIGVRTLIISNACGSMNPLINKKSIMLIDDHINLLPGNPLIGVNDRRLGNRFVDMSEPYSKELIAEAEYVAVKNHIKLHRGVYVAMSGPSLETRAEYRFLRAIGADVVGMSTVPETIVALQEGMKVLGLSVVTDECYPDSLAAVDIEEIIKNADSMEDDMSTIVKGVIERIS